ncbi:threonine--tRNA ligase [Kitasatospora sp. NPDC088391]|uniref:threonine--tRNA ligase n=1 Tax=Kitasatospora sp. NPDC088391 TaxID=3364074 RepID=UPI0037F34019
MPGAFACPRPCGGSSRRPVPRSEETAVHDHRRLGRELALFDTDPLIGSGLPYWLPDGAALRQSLEDYVRTLERRAGYRHVSSPVLGKRELYEVSGHWAHYREDMFPPLELGSGPAAEQLVLRPSLCPHHALMFRSRTRSYRELPFRMAELGDMYRSERSGVLGGLSRVRAIRLNDAHVFCAPEQVAAEVRGALELIAVAHRGLGIVPSRHRLSLPGPGGKYAARPELWERSTEILAGVLAELGVPYEEGVGEAAFYGPKIDVQVVDGAGRESTLSTVQVDFHQPERFDLSYIGPDGARHRPVMVHRSIVGSLERAVAHLIERHGGAFPAWLSPVQLAVLPLGPGQVAAAHALAARCRELDLRAEVLGPERGSPAARVRAARLVPGLAMLGPRELADGTLALRLRDGRRPDPLPVDAALERIAARVREHAADLW